MTKKTHITFLFLIIVGGFLLRYACLLWGQGYRESAITDELEAYRVARGFLAGEREAMYIAQPNFPQAHTGHLPGPLMTLFWAVLLRLGGGPETVMIMLLVLDTMVIGIVYALGKRMLGGAQALWAALFYATAPWPVYYSIGCWNPQYLAPLGALLALTLWNVMTRPASRQIFWVCLLWAMMPQFHAFGVFLTPSIVLLLGIRWREINRTWLVLGMLACMALYTPYIIGEAGNHWDNTRRILSGGKDAFTFGSFKSLTLLVVCLSNLFNSPLSYHFNDYREFGRAAFGSFWVLAGFNLLSLTLALLFIGNLLVELFRTMLGHWLRPREAFERAPAIVFLGIFILVPLLIFLVTGRNFSSRYLVVLMPLLSLLPAMWIARMQALARWRTLATTCLVATVGFNVVLSLLFFHEQARAIAEGPYFIPSFRRMEEVRQKLAAVAGTGKHIAVDDSAFTQSPTDKQARGVHSLAAYLRIWERYRPQAKAAKEVQWFRALSATNLVDARDRVVYQGNGIVLLGPRS